jgi:hypothetical protein
MFEPRNVVLNIDEFSEMSEWLGQRYHHLDAISRESSGTGRYCSEHSHASQELKHNVMATICQLKGRDCDASRLDNLPLEVLILIFIPDKAYQPIRAGSWSINHLADFHVWNRCIRVVMVDIRRLRIFSSPGRTFSRLYFRPYWNTRSHFVWLRQIL